jgi:hypothetical protein
MEFFKCLRKLGLTVGFDYGAEEESAESSDKYVWYSPVVILRYAVTEKLALALRGEYYDDENGVIIATGTPNGFKTSGVSFNVDYAIQPNVLWRTEIRTFSSKDDVFTDNDEEPVKTNTFIGTSLAVSF